jgi:FtsP/CotA-like multicopper oxidase with cupredoxin domain
MHTNAVRLWASGMVAGVLAIAAGTVASAQAPMPRLNPRRGFSTELQRDFDKAGRMQTAFKNPDNAPYDGQFKLRLSSEMFDSPDAAKEDPSFPTRFQLLCYNKSGVGPTIRVKRGTKFRIHVKNDLDKHSPDPGENPNDIGVAWEAYHGLCTTNLHTHGLHVSPSGNSDNIFTVIDPVCDFTYEYEIDKSHPSGTF